ncbi:MAG: dihydroneopterin aldolase [Bacteroidales bacterium]|nr:MAG: dihydroneopterin aldolase [Bacteroidales bacterium]
MKIILKDIEIKAYHGIYDIEKREGNKFSVDIELDIDAKLSAQTDNIADTLNYEDIYRIVREEMALSVNLLENVVYRIEKKINKEFPTAKNIRVAVAKYNPFRDGHVGRVVVMN